MEGRREVAKAKKSGREQSARLKSACKNARLSLVETRLLGVPPWSLFFLSKIYRDFEASSLGILVFRGTFRPI